MSQLWTVAPSMGGKHWVVGEALAFVLCLRLESETSGPVRTRLSVLLSRGSTEVLGGLVRVTDGQADGSDVLYGLMVAERNYIYLYIWFLSHEQL